MFGKNMCSKIFEVIFTVALVVGFSSMAGAATINVGEIGRAHV